MKVLLIGNGGREHALAWKLAQSSRVTQLFIAPGNAGTAQVGDNVRLDPMKFDAVEKFIRANGVEFVVIGPEDPLAAGLADRLTKMKIPVFGPSAKAAQLEADKAFAKELMRAQAIPTAEARLFNDVKAAEEYINARGGPLVVKATGLAKGKGVSVCPHSRDALEAVDRIMRQKSFGDAGNAVLIEEKLNGPECSILAFVSNSDIYIMETCQDHKPAEDGDKGPMTGGMGAYSPTPVVTDEMLKHIEREILIPAVDGLRRLKIDYRGVLYAGLMMTPAGPRVLEFNCRFGDPETQPLMMRLQSDLLEVMLAVAENRLDSVTLKWDPRPALCVVAASGGYPGAYKSEYEIHGLAEADSMPDVKVFHAATKLDEKRVLTAGGRVLTVTALGKDIADAQKKAYAAMDKISFEGMHCRRDIGHQAIKLGL